MDDDLYARLRGLSESLTGNNTHLVVAWSVVDVPEGGTVIAPEIVRCLAGRCPGNRVLASLGWLCELGALSEPVRQQRPSPRVFVRGPSAFWTFLPAWVAERDLASTPAG